MDEVDPVFRSQKRKSKHQNHLSYRQTRKLLRRAEGREVRQAARRQEAVKKLRQERCQKCEGKGHTLLELDERGVYKVSSPQPSHFKPKIHGK